MSFFLVLGQGAFVFSTFMFLLFGFMGVGTVFSEKPEEVTPLKNVLALFIMACLSGMTWAALVVAGRGY